MLNFSAFLQYWKGNPFMSVEKCLAVFKKTNDIRLYTSPERLRDILKPSINDLLNLTEDIVWCRILPAGFYYDFDNIEKIKALRYAYCTYDKSTKLIRNHTDYTDATEDTVHLMEGETFLLPKFLITSAKKRDLLSNPLTFTVATCTASAKIHYIDIDVFYARYLITAHSNTMLQEMEMVIRTISQTPGTYFPPTFVSAQKVMECSTALTPVMCMTFDIHCYNSWYYMREHRDLPDLISTYTNMTDTYLQVHSHFRMLMDGDFHPQYASGVGIWFDIGYLFNDTERSESLMNVVAFIAAICSSAYTVWYPVGRNRNSRLIHNAKTNMSTESQYLKYINGN